MEKHVYGFWGCFVFVSKAKYFYFIASTFHGDKRYSFCKGNYYFLKMPGFRRLWKMNKSYPGANPDIITFFEVGCRRGWIELGHSVCLPQTGLQHFSTETTLVLLVKETLLLHSFLLKSPIIFHQDKGWYMLRILASKLRRCNGSRRRKGCADSQKVIITGNI